jgi:hypothetical protein
MSLREIVRNEDEGQRRERRAGEARRVHSYRHIDTFQPLNYYN